jgi:hypothetical protein
MTSSVGRALLDALLDVNSARTAVITAEKALKKSYSKSSHKSVA